MKPTTRILLYFVLPIIAILLFPLDSLLSSLPLVLFMVVLFIALGMLLLRGKSLALTLAIFLLGLNGIIRMMMFFSRSVSTTGQADLPFIITSLLSLVLSTYLLLRLDRPDVRIQMVS
ncbi:MAG: hypothetical protein EHM70_00500 [Chloroflexota bacterium]|nr:MAG: hypothetical protein EHM70_00500 [Chloroflexota bacterium]